MNDQPAWVLVVNDDAAERMALFRLLEREGHNATVVDDGRAALALLAEEPYDLVLLTLAGEGLEDRQVLEMARGRGGRDEMPVIVICRAEEMAGAVRLLELGAVDYLHRPVEPALLCARVGAGLMRKRLRDLEREQREQVNRLLAAIQDIGAEAFDPAILEPLARRTSPLGLLAAAFMEMAARVGRGERLLHAEVAEVRGNYAVRSPSSQSQPA